MTTAAMTTVATTTVATTTVATTATVATAARRRCGEHGLGDGLPGDDPVLDELAHVARVDEHDAAAVVGLPATARDGEELEVVGRDVRRLLGEGEDVPPLVDDHGLARDGGQGAEPGRVGERAAGEDLVGHRGEERLLAADPREVALGQPVPLADECQRIATGDRLRPGGEPGAGQLVVDGVVEADVDAADRGGEVVEAEQVDLGVVVDGQSGQVFHGPDQGAPAGLRGLGLHAGAIAHAIGPELLGDLRLRRGVRRIDLVPPVAGDVDVRVPWHGEADGGARALGHVQHHDRVGVQDPGVRTGPQLPEHLGRQRVALRIGAAVHPDQQDRLRAVVPAAGDDVGGRDAGGDVAVEAPRGAGEPEHEGRDQHQGSARPASPRQPAGDGPRPGDRGAPSARSPGRGPGHRSSLRRGPAAAACAPAGGPRRRRRRAVPAPRRGARSAAAPPSVHTAPPLAAVS